MADGTLKVGTITNSAGSGNITIGAGVTLLSNVPAFEASVSADQTVSSSTWTVAACDTVGYDTDSCYNNSTYKFTPTVAGKYICYGYVYGQCSTDNELNRVIMALSKNGSRTVNATMQANTSSESCVFTPSATVVYDLNGSTDYVQMEGFVHITAGNAQISGASNQRSYFGAYKLGA
jgi:hypothetical protein